MTTTATIKTEFVIEKQGRRFVLAGGLLDASHRTFDHFDIATDLVVIGSEDNAQTWVVKATVTCPNGTFTQLGDASPASVGPMVKTRLVAMAETRAVTRALRLAVNAAALLPFDDVEEDAERAQMESHASRAAPREPPGFAEPTSAKPLIRAEPTLARAPGPPHAGPATMPTPHATEQQVQTIYRLGADRHQLATKALDADCALRFANLKPAELSVDQAGQYIKMLQRGELSR